MSGLPSSADALLDGARGGDRAALAKLLEEIGPRVRGRIAGRIPERFRSVLDADDVMQVTYLEAVTRFETFTEGNASGFLAWMTRLAENNVVDAVRALEAAKRPNPRKRVRASPGHDSMVALVELLGVTNTTPSIVAARDEGVGLLKVALAKLPTDYRRVITMYDLEGRSAEEVSREMGRSTGAVFMLRARAHDRLREEMGSASQFFSTPG